MTSVPIWVDTILYPRVGLLVGMKDVALYPGDTVEITDGMFVQVLGLAAAGVVAIQCVSHRAGTACIGHAKVGDLVWVED